MAEKIKCFICGKNIKGQYTWEGEFYGKTCWKKHALPLLLAQRNQKDAEAALIEYEETARLVQVLKAKKLDRIQSAFKLEFIPSVIEQFKEKGFLSLRQREIAAGMLNGTDYNNWFILDYRAGESPDWYVRDMTGLTIEQIKNYKKI